LTPQARRQLAQGEADSAAIKREIEQTRIEMSETIGEIQERLRPEHLLQQAKGRRAGSGHRKGEEHHEFGERNSI
jgi:ribosomal protein L19E